MTVGLIANPASGKDVRRLTAHGSNYENHEKVNILRRALQALDALGVPRVYLMPDLSDLGLRALEGLSLSLEARLLRMPVRGDERDTEEAVRRMREAGVRALLVLGGDGTCRAVARASGDLPFLPLSTGTNNVVPYALEGTVAGLAVGLVALGRVPPEESLVQVPWLEVLLDGRAVEVALVDAVLCRKPFLGARALWEPHALLEAVVVRPTPWAIGVAGVAGWVARDGEEGGVYLRFGPGGTTVLAPLAPGRVEPVGVAEWRTVPFGRSVPLTPGPYTLALDGERCLEVFPHTRLEVRPSRGGPRVVDPFACIRSAQRRGILAR